MCRPARSRRPQAPLPNVACPSPPTLLSDAQRRTLRAVIDTVLAPVTDDATVERLVAAHATRPHLAEVGATAERIERFLRLPGSEIPGLADAIESALQRHAPADVSGELALLLTVMGSSAGMLALTLTPALAAPFAELSAAARQRAFGGFAKSMIGPKRKAFTALKQLVAVKAFGLGLSPEIWQGIGYAGPRPSAEVDADATAAGRPERNFAPHMIDPSELPRSGGGGAIEEGAFDAIVVGSGCGGSLVAARLTERGHRVLLVEKGSYLPRAALTGTEAEFDRLYERGGLAVTEDSGISVLAGATLGGGSTVNWACSLEPPYHLRQEWASPPHGCRHFTSAAFQRSVDRVTARQSVVGGRYGNRGGAPFKQNVANTLLIDGCEGLGMSVKAAPNGMVQPGAAEDTPFTHAPTKEMGEVGVGDRGGLKQSMGETYLWDAACTGRLKILANCEVARVLHKPAAAAAAAAVAAAAAAAAATGRPRNACAAAGIEGTVTLPSGEELTLVARAPVVVISGGSINSPAILLRSQKQGLPQVNRSGMVGRNLRLHPVVGVVAQMPTPVEIWSGAPMTTVSDVVSGGLRGDHYGPKLEVPAVMPGYIAALLPWESALQYKELCLDMRRIASFIVLQRDRGDTGAVTLDAATGQARMSYPLEAADRENLTEGLVTAVRAAAAAGAERIGSSLSGLGMRELPPAPPPPPSSSASPAAEQARADALEALVADIRAHGVTTDFRTLLFSAHQMGTCRMGADPRASVVAPTGETWGVDNLFVADASVFPTSSGVNPMITTLSIADGIADHVVDRVRVLAAPGARL